MLSCLTKKEGEKFLESRLNPYCAGRCSRAFHPPPLGQGANVLILIVLEGALVLVDTFVGSTVVFRVLILIVLEGALVPLLTVFPSPPQKS